MTQVSIPTRSEIAKADTWDLTQLFPTEEDYRSAFERYKAAYSKLGEYSGRLNRSAKDLLECLECEKSLDLIAERLGHYASLKIAEDGSNHENLARRAELTNLLTRAREPHAGGRAQRCERHGPALQQPCR